MKKITRMLSLALALAGTTATAQDAVTSLEGLTAGWYRIQAKTLNTTNIGSDENFTGYYLASINAGSYPANNYGSYALTYTKNDTTNLAAQYFYVSPTATSGAFSLVPAGGFHANNACGVSPDESTTLTLSYEENGFKIGTTTYWGVYHTSSVVNGALIVGASYSFSSNRYDFLPASPEGTVYKVKIVNPIVTTTTATGIDPNNYIVSCSGNVSGTVTKVHDGGFYFVPEGGSLSESDFSIENIETMCGSKQTTDFYNAAYFLDDISVAITNANRTETGYDKLVSITIKASQEKLAALQSDVEEMIESHQGLGYLHDATALRAALPLSDGSEASVKAVVTAINSIEMPQDGHAYRIKNTTEGVNRVLSATCSDGSTWTLEAKSISSTEDASTIFVCHKISDGVYTFSNGLAGQFMLWRGDEGSTTVGDNSNSGFRDDYQTSTCNFTLATCLTSTSITQGKFQLRGKRANSNDGAITIKGTDGTLQTYDYSIANGSTYYNLWTLEEVSYYNDVTLRTPATSDGHNYATLYLPFAATIPEGVTAYTAQLPETGSKKLRLTEVSGGVLPAKEPVVLISSSEETTAALFVPATTTGTKSESNGLKGVVEETACTSGVTTYALNGAFASGIGFYPYSPATLPEGRAYYEVAAADNADVPTVEAGLQGLLFDIEGESTGIASAQADGDAREDVYHDLSGRRVLNPTRGIYIRNGRKVILK